VIFLYNVPFLALHKTNANPSHTNHICGLDQSAALTPCGRSPANSGKNCLMALSGAGVRRARWSGGKSRNETRVAKNNSNNTNSGYNSIPVMGEPYSVGIQLRVEERVWHCFGAHTLVKIARRDLVDKCASVAFVIFMPFQNDKFGAEHQIAVRTAMDFLSEGET